MAAQGTGHATLGKDVAQHRTHVGNEAVVAGHEFVELSAGGDVLVLEAERLAMGEWPADGDGDFVVNGGEHIASAGKEAAHRGESVRYGIRARCSQLERHGLTGEPIHPAGLGAPAPLCPELIGQVLLHERNFGLYREDDVTKPRRGAEVGCDAGEDPRGSLLVHEPARAIDGIHKQPPAALCFGRAVREHEAFWRETLGDEDEWFIARNGGESVNERGFAHPVHGIDGVTRVIVRHLGHCVVALLLACGYDRRANAVVEVDDGRQQVVGVGHQRCRRRKSRAKNRSFAALRTTGVGDNGLHWPSAVRPLSPRVRCH